jgi:hypothetical protein
MKLLPFATACLAVIAFAACDQSYRLSAERGKAEHVVVMVWDGMRPDLVSAENTPNLHALAQRGVFFANHHPAYPTTTEVNGTVFATGVLPARSGIIGNKEYRPAIDAAKPVGTEEVEAVRKGDAISGGRHIAVATVMETVQQAGFRTAVAGTKPVALLQDRAEERKSKAARESVTVFAGKTAPAAAAEGLRQSLGGIPLPVRFPNTAQDRWTTDVLTRELWKPGVPKYSVLWVSDPDFSQHYTAPGAPTALAALRSADEMLGIVVATLKERGVLEKTDIMIVSDHGFSTVSEAIDLPELLNRAGFRASTKFVRPPATGDILLVNTGATMLFYVTGHDADTTARLVRFLQQAPFSGVIFTRQPADGTFPLAAAGIDSPDAPDVALSMRWSAEKNEFGVPGLIVHDSGKKAGGGMHGTLSPFDSHNTLIAAGPDFRSGMKSELPSGNIDVAPTVLWLLGIRPLAPLDGRVLFEAIRDRSQPATSQPEEKRIEAVRGLGSVHWQQYLRTVTYGGVTYFMEGNGAQTAE